MPDMGGFTAFDKTGLDMGGFRRHQPLVRLKQPDMGATPTGNHLTADGPNWTVTVNTGGGNSSRRVWSDPTLGVAIAFGSFTTNSANIARTTDGVTWTQINVGAGVVDWSCAAYLPDLGRLLLWAGTGVASTTYAYSDDLGLTWTAGVMPVAAQWACAAYGNGIVVVTDGFALTTVAYWTTDGITFNSTPMSQTGIWAGVAYSPEERVWCAVDSSGGKTCTSLDNALSWRTEANAPSPPVNSRTDSRCMVWIKPPNGAPGLFIYPSSGVAAQFFASTDGRQFASTCRIAGLVGSGTFGELFVGDGVILSAQNSVAHYALSYDGISWTMIYGRLAPGANNRLFGMLAPGLWVAVNFTTTGAFVGVA